MAVSNTINSVKEGGKSLLNKIGRSAVGIGAAGEIFDVFNGGGLILGGLVAIFGEDIINSFRKKK